MALKLISLALILHVCHTSYKSICRDFEKCINNLKCRKNRFPFGKDLFRFNQDIQLEKKQCVFRHARSQGGVIRCAKSISAEWQHYVEIFNVLYGCTIHRQQNLLIIYTGFDVFGRRHPCVTLSNLN